MEGVLPPRIQWRTTKAPFSPDYYVRLKQSSQYAWQVLTEIAQNDPVRELINVELIQEALKNLDEQQSWEPGKSEDTAKLIVQRGIHVIRFLQWFEKLSP